jgi:hypothetical protein
MIRGIQQHGSYINLLSATIYGFVGTDHGYIPINSTQLFGGCALEGRGRIMGDPDVLHGIDIGTI